CITAGGGNDEVNKSVVSTMPISDLLGSFAHEVPSPPAQPYAPTVGPRPTRRTCTARPKPQPCEPSGDGPAAPRSTPSWSVVMTSTAAGDNSRPPSGSRPPARSI